MTDFNIRNIALEYAIRSAEPTAGTEALVSRATAFRKFLNGEDAIPQKIEEEVRHSPLDAIVSKPQDSHKLLSTFFEERWDELTSMPGNDRYSVYANWVIDQDLVPVNISTFKARYEAWATFD